MCLKTVEESRCELKLLWEESQVSINISINMISFNKFSEPTEELQRSLNPFNWFCSFTERIIEKNSREKCLRLFVIWILN